MSVKLNDIEEAFCRLTMHEFLLEIMMANQMADCAEESVKSALDDIVNSSTKGYGVMTGDPEAAQRLVAMNERIGEMTENFVAKLAKREALIRAQRSQAR